MDVFDDPLSHRSSVLLDRRRRQLSNISFLCICLLVVWMRLEGGMKLDFQPSFRYHTKANRLPFCTRSQLQSGQWIRSTDAPPYPTGSDGCFNDDYNATKTYEWQPTEYKACLFEKFSPIKFCSLMKEATIMFVGDSLTWEHYRTLVEILGGQTATLLQFRTKHRQMTIVQSVCDHQRTFLMYRREDSLQDLDLYLKEKFPVVLVLNRGAHYTPDNIFASELYTTFQQVSSWQHKCNEYGVQCHLFWRTSVPGHPACRSFTAPVNNLTLMEYLVATGESPAKYRWETFKTQNELALQLLKDSPVTVYDVIDAYPINILRPDQHARPNSDCLHSCRPGKLDVYNQLLQHFLVQKRSRADVQALENFAFPWNRTTNVQADGHDIIYG